MHALKLKAHIDSSHRIEIQLLIDASEVFNRAWLAHWKEMQ